MISTLDTDANLKQRKSKYIGIIIGDFTIIDVYKYKAHFKYKVKCCNCGYEKFLYSSDISSGKARCSQCNNGKTQYAHNRLQEYKDLYINKTVWDFNILDIYHKNDATYATAKCKCGNIIDRKLTKIVHGQIKSCAHCGRKNLETGIKIMKDANVEGTNILLVKAIADGRRSTNKNSSTKTNGVSMIKNGRYRAYINFARKQYHLGTFDTVEEAKEARKKAEKEIYGKFLEEHEI